MLALFTFYAVPSSGKYKCALVHSFHGAEFSLDLLIFPGCLITSSILYIDLMYVLSLSISFFNLSSKPCLLPFSYSLFWWFFVSLSLCICLYPLAVCNLWLYLIFLFASYHFVFAYSLPLCLSVYPHYCLLILHHFELTNFILAFLLLYYYHYYFAFIFLTFVILQLSLLSCSIF